MPSGGSLACASLPRPPLLGFTCLRPTGGHWMTWEEGRSWEFSGGKEAFQATTSLQAAAHFSSQRPSLQIWFLEQRRGVYFLVFEWSTAPPSHPLSGRGGPVASEKWRPTLAVYWSVLTRMRKLCTEKRLEELLRWILAPAKTHSLHLKCVQLAFFKNRKCIYISRGCLDCGICAVALTR